MNGEPTIRDVAREAGVSTKTVSRVTNGDDYVTAETAERVRRTIERLGRPGADRRRRRRRPKAAVARS